MMTKDELTKVMEMIALLDGVHNRLRALVKLYYTPEELEELPGVSTIPELLDFLRLATKYTLFDANSYRLELEWVKKRLKKAENG